MKLPSKETMIFGYTLARLPIGTSFLIHGIVRMPKIERFAEGMATGFQDTFLPYPIVLGYAYVLPFIELALGILIILGAKIRWAAAAGVVLMCSLIFGSGLQENWSGIAIQMFYGLYLSLLFIFSEYNKFIFSLRLKRPM